MMSSSKWFSQHPFIVHTTLNAWKLALGTFLNFWIFKFNSDFTPGYYKKILELQGSTCNLTRKGCRLSPGSRGGVGFDGIGAAVCAAGGGEGAMCPRPVHAPPAEHPLDVGSAEPAVALASASATAAAADIEATGCACSRGRGASGTVAPPAGPSAGSGAGQPPAGQCSQHEQPAATATDWDSANFAAVLAARSRKMFVISTVHDDPKQCEHVLS